MKPVLPNVRPVRHAVFTLGRTGSIADLFLPPSPSVMSQSRSALEESVRHPVTVSTPRVRCARSSQNLGRIRSRLLQQGLNNAYMGIRIEQLKSAIDKRTCCGKITQSCIGLTA